MPDAAGRPRPAASMSALGDGHPIRMMCEPSDRRRIAPIMFAADYPFLDVLWTMIIFFIWVMWIWMMVYVFTDVFRRRDIGGFAKAAWCVFMLVAPFLGVFVYLIAQHNGIAERNVAQAAAAERAFDARVQAAAATAPHNGGGTGPA